MGDPLSALDATFLELEQQDDCSHMHIGAVMVFDPLPGGGAPTIDAVRDLLGARLGMLPRYSQRLSHPRTHGLWWPHWDDDPRFDLAAHVRHATLPAPGDDGHLREWAADFWSHRLDRSRPLWEMTLVDGLAGGRWALVNKTHHCLVDGVGSVDVGHLLLDAAPVPDPRDRRNPPEQTNGRRAREGPVLHVPAIVNDGLRALAHPLETVERAARVAELLVRDEVIPAPRTGLNGEIGGTRRFAVAEIALSDVKAIKGALGGTVNDVVLALATAALRRLLLARGETLPTRGLRAMVPVNVRDAGEHLALGNRVASLFVSLPVAEHDPLRRFELVRASQDQRKRKGEARAAATVLDLTQHAPPVLHAALARMLYANRLFNVTVTNVPGPQATLYAFGAPMREVWPLVPLFAGHAFGMAIVSYDGTLFFGLIADHDEVPELRVAVHAIGSELAELRSHAAVAA